jgi:hypothetical protein
MSTFSRSFKNYTLTTLAVVLMAMFCAAQQQPTSKAQPRPTPPRAAGKVTRATLGAVVPAGKPCPVTVQLNGTITTNGATEVKYTWLSSDNSTWPQQTINFTKAETQKAATTWQLGKTYNGWVQLKVLSPNSILSPRANFKVNCGGTTGGTGKVTRAAVAATFPRGAACPLTVTFHGSITANGAATVKYTWVSFDGGTWPEGTTTFARAGTNTVTESRQVFANQNGWMQLKVLSPNALISPQAHYSVTCAAKK